MTTKNLMKRVMPLALAFLMVLTTVLVPVSAKAAERKPSGVGTYTMVVDEQWTAPIFFASEDAVVVSNKINKKKVATVDENGVVPALKKGKCKLTTVVKQGGKSYKIKTKIVVKNDITWQEFVARALPEFACYYQECFDLAYANGWVDDDGNMADETYGQWLNNYYQVIAGVQQHVIDNPGSKTDEELQQIYDELMYPIMEQVPTAYEFFSVPFEG